MTSPWSEGIAGDFADTEDTSPDQLCIITKRDGLLQKAIEQALAAYDKCQCKDCRAIVALVEEEIIDKP